MYIFKWIYIYDVMNMHHVVNATYVSRHKYDSASMQCAPNVVCDMMTCLQLLVVISELYAVLFCQTLTAF